MSQRVEFPLSELPPGQMKRVVIDGEAVCVAHVDGKVYAVSDTCTHAMASLAEGFLDGDEIVCPLHGAMFDLRNGKVTCGPATEDLKRYHARIEGEKIIVEAQADDQ